MNNQYDNILDALADLDKKGYNQSFIIRKNGLYSILTEQTLKPEDVQIVEYHRFEGDTNVSDMAILYAIETSEGSKGVLIDAFGTYGNSDLGEFLKRVKYRTIG